MKSFPVLYKQILLPIFIIGIAIFSNPKLQAQEDYFNLEIRVKEASSPTGNDASIIISVDKPDTQYEYLLYNKEPWDGGKLIAEIKSNEQKAEFSNIASGKYYICVRNSSKTTKCKDVSLESTQN